MPVSDFDPIRLDHDGVLQRLHALVGTFVSVHIDGLGPSVGFPDAPPGLGFPIAWFGGTLLVGNQSPLDARTEDEIGGIDFWVGDHPQGDGVDFAWGVARLSGFQLSRDTFEEGIAESDEHVAFRAGQTIVSVSTVSVYDADALHR